LKSDSCKHIYQFNIDEKLSKDLFEAYFKTMKGRKKKPKKVIKKGKGTAKKR
jgi:hypothetical protein